MIWKGIHRCIPSTSTKQDEIPLGECGMETATTGWKEITKGPTFEGDPWN